MTTESCQNDGEVGPDCECKCKEGFTGESCEAIGKVQIQNINLFKYILVLGIIQICFGITR